MTFGRNQLTHDCESNLLGKIPADWVDDRLRLRVLVYRPMFEAVVNDGQAYLTSPRQSAALGSVTIKPEGGSVVVESLEVHRMKSIWKQRE